MSMDGLIKAGKKGFFGLSGLLGAKLMEKKESDSASPTQPVNTPQVDSDKTDTADQKTAKRIGRAALLSTSPLGVTTTDPTGRRKILGN